MDLTDTTVARNSEPDMAAYYLYRMESPARRWGLAVEQLREDRFHVAVTYAEPEWDVHGVVRYWSYETRDLAEARYLELQRVLGAVEESLEMKAILAVLPAVERAEAADEA
ncbi:MAG: hypothetical protein VKP62_04790 [Candidatus Sericytochromatia bacterium]|nr:hypothetical protein [Candidatus Sericytochromatia bacterium]